MAAGLQRLTAVDELDIIDLDEQDDPHQEDSWLLPSSALATGPNSTAAAYDPGGGGDGGGGKNYKDWLYRGCDNTDASPSSPASEQLMGHKKSLVTKLEEIQKGGSPSRRFSSPSSPSSAFGSATSTPVRHAAAATGISTGISAYLARNNVIAATSSPIGKSNYRLDETLGIVRSPHVASFHHSSPLHQRLSAAAEAFGDADGFGGGGGSGHKFNQTFEKLKLNATFEKLPSKMNVSPGNEEFGLNATFSKLSIVSSFVCRFKPCLSLNPGNIKTFTSVLLQTV